MCTFQVWFGAFCIFNDICIVRINTVSPPTSKCPLSVLQNIAHLRFAVLPWAVTCQQRGHHHLLSGSAELRFGEHHRAGESLSCKASYRQLVFSCDQQSLTLSWQLKLQGSISRFWRNVDFCLTQKAELFVAGKVALYHLSPFTEIPTGIWQVFFLISVINSPLCQVERQISHELNDKASSCELRLWLLSDPMFESYLFGLLMSLVVMKIRFFSRTSVNLHYDFKTYYCFPS